MNILIWAVEMHESNAVSENYLNLNLKILS